MITIIELVMRFKLKRQKKGFFFSKNVIFDFVAFESRLTDAQEIIIDLN